VTEAEVCETTGISRTPVREALLRLEAEGFLQILPKKGAYVPPIADAEVEAVMQARKLVEDWCVRRMTPAAGSLPAELERLITEQRDLLEDPVGFIECDRAFHRAIVRMAGNPVLTEFYETLRERQVRMGLRAIAAVQDRARTVITEHTIILEAVRSDEPDRAAAAVAEHLDSTLAALHLPAIAGWVDTNPNMNGVS
jgi:DNA-binding GntR family transcriptional regulator